MRRISWSLSLAAILTPFFVIPAIDQTANADVQVRLSLAGGKRVYRTGEPIRLALSFRSDVDGYNLNVTTPASPEDEILVTPDDGVCRWLDEYSGKHSYSTDILTMKFLMALLVPALLVISVGLVRLRQASDQLVITAEEYAVYASVIGYMFAGDKVSFDTQSKVTMLVIEDRTVSPLDDGFAGENEVEELKKGFSPIISEETIDDYLAKSAKSHQLTKSLDLKLKYTLIPKEKIKQIFDGLPSSEFYRQFPDSGGYIALSRAGFNSRGDQAFVYMQHICGGLCGSGHYLALVKKNGEWVVQQNFRSWVS